MTDGPSTDEVAFDAFVRDHRRALWQAVVGVAGPDAAADAVSQALLQTWIGWDRVAAMENPVGYVYVIARNEARRAARPDRAPDLADVAHVDDPIVEPDLLPALARLSEMQRQVAYLVEGFGWGLTDTARILGISVSSVRSHLARALDRLRTDLEVKVDHD